MVASRCRNFGFSGSSCSADSISVFASGQRSSLIQHKAAFPAHCASSALSVALAVSAPAADVWYCAVTISMAAAYSSWFLVEMLQVVARGAELGPRHPVAAVLLCRLERFLQPLLTLL